MTTPLPLEGEGAWGWGERTSSPIGPEDSVDRFSRTPRIRDGGIQRARKLRSEPTRTEALLWKYLSPFDVRFRRQSPIGPYVVDFACHSAKLVIEVDGGVHDMTEVALRDLKRDEWLSAQGYRVLRIPAKRIETDIDAVIAEIGKGAGVSGPPGSVRASTPSQPFPLEGKGSSED